MNKWTLLLVVLLAAGCGRKTTVTVEEKPKATVDVRNVKVDHFTVTSPFGHEFSVDVTRFPKEDYGYNNTCKINYIITNTGNKDFRHREVFPGAGGRKATKNAEPALVFEFNTADGKKIEKSQSIYFDISTGRSSEVYTMSIDVGLGSCEGEVKPVRIQYKEQ